MNKNTKLLLSVLVVLAALAGFSVARAAFVPNEALNRAGDCGILLSSSMPIDEGTGLLSSNVVRENGGGLLLVSTLAEINEFGLIDTYTAVRGLAQDGEAKMEITFDAGRGFVIDATPGTWRDAVAHHTALAISRF